MGVTQVEELGLVAGKAMVAGKVMEAIMSQSHLCPTDLDMQYRMMKEMTSTSRSRAMVTKSPVNIPFFCLTAGFRR